jgi:hypothetical protein
MQLQGKTDQKFVETAFKLFREAFGIKTVLTPGNFLEQVRGACGCGTQPARQALQSTCWHKHCRTAPNS